MGMLQITLRYRRRLKAASAYQKALEQEQEDSLKQEDSLTYLEDHEIFSKCRWNRFDVLKGILERENFDLNISDHNGNTTLMVACQNGHDNIVSYLLRNFRNDININAQNKKGQTALHFSQYYRFSNITRILLKQGANGTIQNSYGLTYLEGLTDRFLCKS